MSVAELNAVTLEEDRALDRLIGAYGEVLDNRDMAGWLDLFSEQEEASYLCNTMENVRANLPIALMLDDCRGRLFDRVKFIEEIWVDSFQDYQTRHFTQRTSTRRLDGQTVAMQSNFVIYCTPEDTSATCLMATGVYDDVAVKEGAGFKLLSRKAILDAPVASRYFVYPV